MRNTVVIQEQLMREIEEYTDEMEVPDLRRAFAARFQERIATGNKVKSFLE